MAVIPAANATGPAIPAGKDGLALKVVVLLNVNVPLIAALPLKVAGPPTPSEPVVMKLYAPTAPLKVTGPSMPL